MHNRGSFLLANTGQSYNAWQINKKQTNIRKGDNEAAECTNQDVVKSFFSGTGLKNHPWIQKGVCLLNIT